MIFLKKSNLIKLANLLIKEIEKLTDGKHIRIMEVCGTHTVSIFRYGIKSLLPDNIELISGPGCPVCVTPISDIDKAIEISKIKGVILVTFGDILKVPGSFSSLYKEKAKGANIRVIISPLDAVKIAEENKDKRIVFFTIGFETTSPAIAIAVKEARKRKLKNFFILSSQKLIPPAIKALLSSKKIKIDGFILPGHVSTIIGVKPYLFIANNFKIPSVITGFEGLDILEGIYMLLKQKKEGKIAVEIQYKRAVKEEGNKLALNVMMEVFDIVDSKWRGLGTIPRSGLDLKDKFSDMNALNIFNIPSYYKEDQKKCICGEILQGLKKPLDCPLFKKICTPDNPFGPCMVSSEGVCSVYYKYGEK